MWSRLPLRFKLTTLVLLVVTLAAYMLGRMMYNRLLGLLDKVAGLRAETVADAVVSGLEPGWFQGAVPSGENDSEYRRVEQDLSHLVARGYVQRVEIIRFADNRQVVHFLNVPADNSPDYYRPGEQEEALPGVLYAQRTTGHNFVDLSKGMHTAGWSPLLGADGRPAGLAIVYIDATEIQDALNTASWASLITALILIAASGLTSYTFAVAFERAAVTDGLMGIYNHKFFKQRLEEEVGKSRRYKHLTTLVFLDIDFFKRVNDTYGHATGDLVLKQLAVIVKETSRNTDVVARYGGEEIAVLLTHTGLAGAQEFAERLRLKIAHHVVRDPDEDAEFRVTVSVGVAQWETGVTSLDLIRRADAALYHSKHTGRNRVTIYQDDILLPPQEAQTKPKTR